MKRIPELKLELVQDPNARQTLTSALRILAESLIDRMQAELTGEKATEYDEAQEFLHPLARKKSA